MKLLCFSKYIIIFFLFSSSLFGALGDKSAIVYYGKKISYTMVGVHDYIIVQPDYINTSAHGFSIYKDKMYAYVSIGEANPDIKEYEKIDPKWILTENKFWNTKVLDIKNPQYHEFLFKQMIEPLLKQGFKNFFFDTLDSYQLYAKTLQERQEYETALANFINTFHKRFPHAKLIINRGFEVIDEVHDSIEAVLFESYHYGLGGKKISLSDKEWLDIHINKIKSYNIDVISVDYLEQNSMDKADEAIQVIQSKGMIPYVSNSALNIYGVSSKNALKREILVLVDESQNDRASLSAHQYGALPLEYMGYIQKLYEINQGLPKIEEMGQYAGVIIWLDEYYNDSSGLLQWVIDLQKRGIKVAFLDNFGFMINQNSLEVLGIQTLNAEDSHLNKKRIVFQDEMMGYEIQPPLSIDSRYFQPKEAEPLLVYEDSNHLKSTTAAIMPWGGYVVNTSLIMKMNNENIWVIDPFKFFAKALRLKPLLIPDVTTENGNRLLFSHIDGDGIMNRAEWNPNLFSGEVILEEILKPYKIPHSVSVIGAEIDSGGLFPDISKDLRAIVKKMYALENVEGATHTFTHPFIWGKIENDDLDEQYRLKVKNYKFSLHREIGVSLEDINTQLLPFGKQQANTVFWSGDCIPTEKVLKYIYERDILNINGGDTTITNTMPWLTYIAPMGLERGDYYQIYTGAQNENIYTNNWLGPFWGFKKVVQTFKLTNSPRRFKPIDIYYHLYSGSKKASLNALKYVFDWALEQDVMPIYTSEYIYKAMDFYTASLCNEENKWLLYGMNSLHEVRLEQPDAYVDFSHSRGVVGLRHVEGRTYIHLDNSRQQLITLSKNTNSSDRGYLVAANAQLVKNTFLGEKQFISFDGHVDLKLHFYLPQNCNLSSSPKPAKTVQNTDNELFLYYQNAKKADINVTCK
ncbi:endo alpha-1,4 polygalactosaminidase [bacterium]|nr:endo alpha-1,4 polygalactosaminidase [bacterium]MBU1995209.1 endo alpha-1,4 polygalactosaminidase [bacterium]